MNKETPTPTLTQAARIYAKFGSAAALTRALAAIGKPRHRLTVEAWGRPKSKNGTGGTIPAGNIPDIERAAEHVGVKLTKSDWDPRPTVVKP